MRHGEDVAALAVKLKAAGDACGCIEEVLATREVEDPPAGYPEWVGAPDKHPSWALDALPDPAQWDPTPEEQGALRDRLLRAGDARAGVASVTANAAGDDDPA